MAQIGKKLAHNIKGGQGVPAGPQKRMYSCRLWPKKEQPAVARKQPSSVTATESTTCEGGHIHVRVQTEVVCDERCEGKRPLPQTNLPTPPEIFHVRKWGEGKDFMGGEEQLLPNPNLTDKLTERKSKGFAFHGLHSTAKRWFAQIGLPNF